MVRGSQFRTVFLSLLLCPAAAPTLRAQTVIDSAAPKLTIATVSGRTTFHIGERIPIILTFTGPPDNTYAIDLANYDRSGRMSEDTFNVEPHTGWADPLEAYFRFASYMGGGLRGGNFLSCKSEEITANLNEWVRFDQPGSYTISVISHRVGHVMKRPEVMPFPKENIDLASTNILKLKIIPATGEWENETLRRISQDLPKGPSLPAVPQELSPSQQHALDDLRFLATPPALHLLAAGLRDDRETRWPSYFGILGLPPSRRDQALAIMRTLLEKPDFPVSQLFLEAMSWLRMPEDEPDMPLPSDLAEMRQAVEQYQQRRFQARDRDWQDAVSALTHKKGAALNTTETTLLEIAPAHPDQASAAALGIVTRATFSQLSPADQARLLDGHWELIRSRELLPQLRAIATEPPADASEADPFFSPRTRIAIALRRWGELEPENAAAEAINQIGRAYPQLYAKELTWLPDETYPQFESFWATTLAEGTDITDYEPAASLLLRFGTGSATAQVADVLRHPKDHLGNRLQPALAYLLKFDPVAAQVILQQDPTLIHGSLDSIAKQTSPSAFLTALALTQLDSSDPAVISDALTYLRHFGDQQTKEPLYEAFLLWHARNKALEDADLNDLSSEANAQLNLGEEFVRALLCNQGYLPDAKLSADILSLAIGPVMRSQAEQDAKQDLHVTAFSGDFESYEIGPFEAPTISLFEKKLDQFPPGTQFTLQHTTSDKQHDQDEVEASLLQLFSKHGMTLSTSGLPMP